MDYSVFLLDKLDLKYSVRDAVHGFVYFNDVERAVINHPWFQRMRYIKQLAFTDYVYPGATHTRFEHSLGVMHLATRMFLRILSKCKGDLLECLGYGRRTRQFEKDVLKCIRIIRLAALLHDIGHGPYSHAAEPAYPFKKSESKQRFDHEDYSVEAIKQLWNQLRGKSLIKNSAYKEILSWELTFLIDQKPKKGELPLKLLHVCRSILSSQLDADRLDYLLRDSHHAGVAYGVFDLERVVEALNFCLQTPTEEQSRIVLAIDKGDFQTAEAVTMARYWMWSSVYLHKTRRILDLLFVHAMYRINVEFPAPNDFKNFALWTEPRLLAAAFDYTKEKELPWVGAITSREFPRLAGTFCSPDRLNRFLQEVRTKHSVVRDGELKSGRGKDTPEVWVDSGVACTPYKYDEFKQIQLRSRSSHGKSPRSKENAVYWGTSLSEESKVIQYSFLSDKGFRESRVYTGVKLRNKIAKLVEKHEGTPCLTRN